MRKIVVLILVLLVIPTITDAQRGVKKGKGGCFCDAAAKKGAGLYTGLNTFAGFFAYKDAANTENTTGFGPGFHLGTNITKKISIEGGLNYYQLKNLQAPDEFNLSSSISYLDIPITIVYRIPNDNNGIIPYLAIGGVNNIVLKEERFLDSDLFETNKINQYEDFFIQAKAGLNIVVANKISLFTGLTLLKSIRSDNAIHSGNVYNFNMRYSLEAGFNYHF